MTETPQPDRNEPADELVVAAGTDREAFGKLFDRFYPLLVAYSLRRLLVREVAEDVTSEVFLKVAVHIRDFKGTTEEDFRRWLLRIATNEINAQLRQKGRRRALLESAARMGVVNAAGWTPGEDGGARLDWQRLYRALGELPRGDARRRGACHFLVQAGKIEHLSCRFCGPHGTAVRYRTRSPERSAPRHARCRGRESLS